MSRNSVRVLHVISGDLWAGAEVMALNLIRQQNIDPNCSVAVVVMNHGALEHHLAAHEIEVTVVDEATTSTVSAILKIRAIAGRFSPDVIHTHRQKENVIGSIVALLRGCASIRTEHGWNEHPATIRNPARWAVQAIDLACGRFFQAFVVAVSDELRTKLFARYESAKVVTIENGIDFRQTIAAAKSGKSLIVEKEAFNLGIIGRIVPVKRVDKFLRVAKSFQAATSDRILFHVVGDGPLIEEMKLLAKRLEISDDVTFHGHVDSAIATLAGLNGLIICSDHEGLPMVALEAGVLQIPFVTVPIPSLEVLIRRGAAGIVCEDHEDSSLAAGLERLHSNDIQSANPEEFERHYSIRNTADAYRRIYALARKN